MKSAILLLSILIVADAVLNDGPSRFQKMAKQNLNQKTKIDHNTDFSNFTNWIENVVMDCPTWKFPGLTVTVVSGQSTLYKGGFGVTDAVSKQPVDENTLFQIGSCSKAFTASLTSKMVDEGNLEFDVPIIYSSFPQLRLKERDVTERVTIRDLFSHRTGLPRHDFLWITGPNITRQEFLDNLQYLDFNYDFRYEFEYNNLMVATAGFIAGKVSGGDGTWESGLRKNILDPLGMKNTSLDTLSAIATGNYAFPHGFDADGNVQAYEKDINQIVKLLGPAGSISSSANEMSTWLQFHLNKGNFKGKQIVSAANLAQNYVPISAMEAPYLLFPPLFPADFTLSAYGMGWWTGTYRGYPMILHDGSVIGAVATTMFFPTANLGIFVATNIDQDNYNSLYEIAMNAFDTAMGYPIWLNENNTCNFPCTYIKCDEEEEEKKASEKFQWSEGFIPRDVSEYIGTYEHPSYGTVEITNQQGQLTLTLNSVSGTLSGFGQDVFNAKMVTQFSLEPVVLPVQFYSKR
eukprot:TRINITY_DN234_c0_g1_i4.p1 TRINITY_DN234_c0_g1~~TRINITY_DN234_c0_g1_i4.p1  ORF type:complete len:525 (-),score=141.48 TRINITY_DN234_c0_g1_i4:206-1759(-)